MEVGGQASARALSRTDPHTHSDLKPDPATAAPVPGPDAAAPSTTAADHSSNNYARPGGQQNVGNFVTGRPTSRVLAPPGGASQISFG